MYLLPYGDTTLAIELPAQAAIDYLQYPMTPGQPDDTLIRKALATPIASPPLRDLARGKASAVILISDHSRLCPSALFLPLLLDELNAGGLPDSAISIIVALGTHRRLTATELQSLTGQAVYERVTVHNHSSLSEYCVYVGTSSRGTPFELNRFVASAELIVATGNIEPHRLVGMSGGVKAIVPGAASQRCITHNHSLTQQVQVTPGQPDNPIHRDLEEVLPFIPPAFLLNVIVDHNRSVVGAVAGDILLAHRAGVEQARPSFFVAPPGPEPYDLVVASAGGHPKDMHLYQALKTLQNAASFTRPGGTIVLVARCEERFGNGVFQYWVETIEDRAKMVELLKQEFVLGAHKVEHLDKILQSYTVYLYSEIPPSIVELTGLLPTNDVSDTLAACVTAGLSRVAVLPYGALTFSQSGG